jgi:hypothetical protein
LCSTENVWVMGKPGQTFAELGIENRIGGDRGEIQDVAVKVAHEQGAGLDVEQLTHAASERHTDPLAPGQSPADVFSERAVTAKPRSKSGDGFHSGMVGVE